MAQTEPVAAPAVTEDFDVSTQGDVAKLKKGAVGLGGVLFLTLTGSAPITAMLLNTPIVVGSGEGLGTPAAFIVATIVLVIFSVGYVAMSRKKTAAGGFYSYISHGLGREIGFGAGFGSLVAYGVFEASLAGGFAYFANLKLASLGVNIGWAPLALGMVVIIGVLCYFDVSLSAKILAVGLVTEVLILLLFDVLLLSKGHIYWSALNPAEAFKSFSAAPKAGIASGGAIGIGLFFAFWSWVGFEMAPNYGEESKNPKKNVGRAMYISVIGLGVFYTLTSWAAMAGYSSSNAAIAKAQTDAANFFFTPSTQYAGHWVTSVMSYLIITGSFACGMAFHNTTARYAYSLGREGMLPSFLGKTHPKWQSPHVASIAGSLLSLIIIGLFAIFVGTNDPSTQAYGQLYGLMAVMGVIIILSVQAVVSLAIVVYFLRFHKDEVHWWTTVLAPVIAFITQGYVVYLLFENISFLGGGHGYAKLFGPIDAAVVLIGIGLAFYYKKFRPETFEKVGRLINEGL
ncbi:MAG TPA: APC family permease [Trebonia sp.]|jgi:amino acid transporter|nr:APC family permease [Trebonia sp.]